MRILLRLTAALGAVAVVGSVLADTEVTADDLRAHIKYLASDELGGRLSVSPGFQLASQYGADRFKQYGLEPKGTDGYFQPFEMSIGVRAGHNNLLYFTVGGKRVDTEAGKDFVPVSGSKYNRWAEGPVVFAGYGLDADYAGIDPTGKVAVIVRDRPENIAVGPLATRVRLAEEKGAVGVILVSAQSDPDTVRLGATRLRGRSPVGIPVVDATRAAAERALGGKTVAGLCKTITDSGKPASFEPAGASVRFIVEVEPNAGESRNVIGFLPGNDPDLKEEIVILGGHLDHVGHGEVGAIDQNTEIHNGADDNASGSAGVMELAEYYAGTHSNRRSMLFILFGGEEEGLIGSNHFANNPTIDLSRVTTMLNFDMIGRLNENKLIVEGVGSSPVWPAWLDAHKPADITLTKKTEGAGPSDHTHFYRKQIPVLFFFTGIHEDYHRAGDDWEKINYDGEVRVLEYAMRMIEAIDSNAEKIAWQNADNAKVEAAPAEPGDQSDDQSPRSANVRVGLVPDYAYEGVGVRLMGVSPGTPAEKAGLREGDIILKWNDIELDGMESMMTGFRSAEPGKPVKLLVQRGSEKIEVTVIPEARE